MMDFSILAVPNDGPNRTCELLEHLGRVSLMYGHAVSVWVGADHPLYSRVYGDETTITVRNVYSPFFWKWETNE